VANHPTKTNVTHLDLIEINSISLFRKHIVKTRTAKSGGNKVNFTVTCCEDLQIQVMCIFY